MSTHATDGELLEEARKAYWSEPSWDKFFMQHVYLAASKSKDPKTKIGAVLVRERHVLATGFNGIPRGVADEAKRMERPVKYFYMEHGERNALYTCARHGINPQGATLYTQGIPCADCARGIIQCGVREVVVHGPWHYFQVSGGHSAKWNESADHSRVMFAEAEVRLRISEEPLGLKGFVDGSVIPV
jgi:dCMP deaminase